MSAIDSSRDDPGARHPMFSSLGLPRFDVLDPLAADLGATHESIPPDWDEVHRVVQGVLWELANRVRRECPEIKPRSGRTSGREFPLFSYVDFTHATIDADDAEAVVVGVLCESTGTLGFLRLSGDISGEESGRIDFRLPERTIRNTRLEVLATVVALSLELADQLEAVVVAIRANHRAPSY